MASVCRKLCMAKPLAWCPDDERAFRECREPALLVGNVVAAIAHTAISLPLLQGTQEIWSTLVWTSCLLAWMVAIAGTALACMGMRREMRLEYVTLLQRSVSLTLTCFTASLSLTTSQGWSPLVCHMLAVSSLLIFCHEAPIRCEKHWVLPTLSFLAFAVPIFAADDIDVLSDLACSIAAVAALSIHSYWGVWRYEFLVRKYWIAVSELPVDSNRDKRVAQCWVPEVDTKVEEDTGDATAQAILEMLCSEVLTVNEEFSIISAWAAESRMFGQLVLGKSLREAIAPDSWDHMRKAFTTISSSSVPQKLQVAFRKNALPSCAEKDTTVIVARTSSKPQRFLLGVMCRPAPVALSRPASAALTTVTVHETAPGASAVIAKSSNRSKSEEELPASSPMPDPAATPSVEDVFNARGSGVTGERDDANAAPPRSSTLESPKRSRSASGSAGPDAGEVGGDAQIHPQWRKPSYESISLSSLGRDDSRNKDEFNARGSEVTAERDDANADFRLPLTKFASQGSLSISSVEETPAEHMATGDAAGEHNERVLSECFSLSSDSEGEDRKAYGGSPTSQVPGTSSRLLGQIAPVLVSKADADVQTDALLEDLYPGFFSGWGPPFMMRSLSGAAESLTGGPAPSTSPSQAARRQRLMVPKFAGTPMDTCSKSLIMTMLHWNLHLDPAGSVSGAPSCCGKHCAAKVATNVLTQLLEGGCDEQWRPVMGWQCQQCLGTNPEDFSMCDICLSIRQRVN